MARSPKPQEEQLALIDVDDPALKAVKKQLTDYESLKKENRDQGSANRTAEQAKRKKVLEAIQGANLKPEADGAYHIRMGGEVYTISQEAQLRVKKAKAPKDNAGDEDEADE